jgi:hypothetical protein
MAIRTPSGGPIEGMTATFVPAEGWTDAEEGDLITTSTGDDYAVAECAADGVPVGIVRAVAPSGSTVTVELFSSGTIARLPASGSPTLGKQIQAASATEVKAVTSGGAGTIVAIGLEADTVDVLFL